MWLPRRSWSLLGLATLLGACDSGQLASAEVRGGSDEGRPTVMMGADAAGPAPDGGPGGAPPGEMARTVFDRDVEPQLTASCASCHAVEASGAPLFLEPDPDVYGAVKGWPGLVDLESPSTSRLLRKGAHAGPAFSTSQASLVTRWLEMESAERRAPPPGAGPMDADAGPAEPVLVTEPILVTEGFNHIDLGAFGTSGASLSFVTARIGSGVYLSDLRVSSGPRGLRLAHPVFIALAGGEAIADPVDTFADAMLELDPNRSTELGSGTLVLVECPAGALLAVHFDAIGPLAEPAMPGADAGVPDGGVPGGDGGMRPPTGACTNVTGFTANARGPLLRNCTRCHDGTNETASAALDMSRVPSVVTADQAMACAQVLTRVDLDDPTLSNLFVQPDPSSGTMHPFKFPSAADLAEFRTTLRRWIDTE